tara:strand:+ start:2500 stop:2712 length:213 start_codon:yes stop_codon:yes gene_type:complete
MNLPSLEEMMYKELKEISKRIKDDTKLRNNMVGHLFNSRKDTGMTVETIAKAAGVSRKHAYTIASKEGNQ